MANALDAFSDASSTGAAPPARAGLTRFATVELPMQLGDFVLRREIAAGGMGTVYEAEEKALHRTVALKMIRAAAFSTPEEKARFHAEAGAAAALDHPHIVPVYEVGEFDGLPFFTMKLIAGGTLAARLKNGALPPQDAAAMMAKIARAVAHAHSRGVLHRDLKPGNILLDAAGEPWLTDFGLAKLAGHETGLTLTHAQLGTPHYMSPEQAAGHARDVSTASDVWALGVMLYQMVSGRLPFIGESPAEVLRQVSETVAPPMPAAHQDLATLAARCLERDPARRLPGAAFLAEELERWLAGEPIRSRPVSTGERVWKWMRRHPMRVAAAAALLASILAGGTASTVLWQRAEQNAAEARTARDAAAEDAYFATVANAFNERSRFDFAAARRQLAAIPAERRDFEWRLVNSLCAGDDLWATKLPGARLLARDAASGKVCVLSGDRSLHFVDETTGALTPAGRVPDVPDEAKGQRTRSFGQFAFAPDGRHYFVTEGGALCIVERESGTVVYRAKLTSPRAAWLDSGRLIFGDSSRYRVPTGQGTAWTFDLGQKDPVEMPTVPICGPFAVSPDGQYVAWIRQDDDGHRVILRTIENIRTGSPLVAFPEGGGPSVNSLVFSDDGQTLAVAWAKDPNSSVTLHEVPSGKQIASQPVSPQARVAGGPGGRVAIFGGEAWINVLNPAASSRHAVYDDGNQGMGDFIDVERALKPPMRHLTRTISNRRIGFLFGHEAPPRSVLFLPEKNGILSAGDDDTVRRWPLVSRVPDRQRLNNVETLHNHYHPIASPDGTHVLAHEVKGPAFVFRFADKKRFDFPDSEQGLAAFDNGRVLTRDADGHRIVCYDTRGGSLALLWETPCGGTIGGFRQIIHSATSPDGNRIAVLMPGKIITIEMSTRTVRETGDQVMSFGSTPGLTVAISPDGKTVAVTGFVGQRARFYAFENPAAGHEKLQPAADLISFDTACEFSRDGTRLYVGNEDGRVRVFDTATRCELPTEAWQAHTTAITALAVSHDNRIVATAAEGSVALWNAAPGHRERLRLPLDRARNWLHFATADRALLHAAPERPIEVWRAE